MRGSVVRWSGIASRSARNLLSPTGIRGTAVEVAWLAAHIASYPFGVAQERPSEEIERYTLDGLSPMHRGLLIGDVEAAGTPILLVHGLVDNRSIFAVLRRALRRRGFGRRDPQRCAGPLRAERSEPAVFGDRDAVDDGAGERSTGAAFAVDDGDRRRPAAEHRPRGRGDRGGDPGSLARGQGIGAGSVDEHDKSDVQPVRQFRRAP